MIQPGRPCGRRLAAACGPRVEGPDPVDNADERRIPRGGSLQESKFQVWPAAIRPQTPAVPGTKRPPGFGRHSGAPRRLDISQVGHPILGRHGRAPRDTPNTVGRGGFTGNIPEDAKRSCSRRPSPSVMPGPSRQAHHTQKERQSSRKDVEARLLSSLHILTDHIHRVEIGPNLHFPKIR